jgi:hypothetical protein
MTGASELTGAVERVGATPPLFKWRLYQAIRIQAAHGVVATHAGHHNVAFPHLGLSVAHRLRRSSLTASGRTIGPGHSPRFFAAFGRAAAFFRLADDFLPPTLPPPVPCD